VVWAQLWRRAPNFTLDARLTGGGSAPYGPPFMTTPPFPATSADTKPRLAPERPQDAAAVEGLIDRAFGPGRRVKAAERLRERNCPALDLSLAAWAGPDAALARALRRPGTALSCSWATIPFSPSLALTLFPQAG
jgi:hypothetical protein